MTTLDFSPLTVAVPLWEDPPGVVRVGDSRVLLELVLNAFKRGESAEGIVRSYRTLRLAHVYAIISRYFRIRLLSMVSASMRRRCRSCTA